MGNMQELCQLFYTFKSILQIVKLGRWDQNLGTYFEYEKYVKYLSTISAPIFYIFLIWSIFGVVFYIFKIGTIIVYNIWIGPGRWP